MAGGGGGAPPPVDGGEFLLQLLKKPTHHQYHPDQSQSSARAPPQPTQILTHDPAVAAFGPTVSIPFPHQLFSSNGLTPPSWPHNQNVHQRPPLVPHGYFFQNPSPNPNSNISQVFPSASPPGRNQSNFQQNNAQFNINSSWDGVRKPGFLGTSSNASSAHLQDAKDLVFGSLRANEGFVNANYGENLLASVMDQKNLDLLSLEDKRKLDIQRLKEQMRELGLEDLGRANGYGINFQQGSAEQNVIANSSVLRGHGQEGSDNSRIGTDYWNRQGHSFNNQRAVVPPPGFSQHHINGGTRGLGNLKETVEQFGESRYRSGKDEMGRRLSSRDGDRRLSRQLDRPGPPAGSKLHSAPASEIEESMMENHAAVGDSGREFGNGMVETTKGDGYGAQADFDDLEGHLVDSLGLEDESGEKSDKKKHHGPRDKDYRSDKRGQWLMGQRMRQVKRQVACRGDIDRWNVPFLEIYESLIPAEEEKAKQKQLLALLEKIVCKEWPEARLFLYGSCANSFGFSKSDIDVCLTIDDAAINKSDVLLKLADLLKSENLQNVQALTHARVPIVKLMDPATGISCDICINNVLAVVNTKLLRDYAQIDKRLRQLAFLVKHWAKSRGVNETYQGTLSSYAYVLMCIHFLQHRRPAILPCLQEMKATYSVTVDNVECSYFDQVENLIGFGSQNRESIAQLVWAFFNYWAYCHDYADDVISVRKGTILSKRSKDWTRRIGNDRHLICIEDPFEVSHDLGRVVDKRSIRVLREEFERAAEIMQRDVNPCVKLFELYVPG